MSEIETRIRQAAAKQKELIRILAESDHAPPDLIQQNRYVADLEQQLAESNKTIKALERKHKRELDDHEKYRDSVMRRFAYKATGNREKFEARAAKEEREYFDVLQKEHQEKEMNQNMLVQLEEAYKARAELEKTAKLHEENQAELDKLYSAIFAGPTPGFPEEDAKERASEAALQSYHDVRSKAEAENHALRLLTDGMNKMKLALNSIEDALSHSRMDMFGGGTVNDMMERNALHRAEMALAEARNLVLHAQRMSPLVRDLPDVRINHGNIMSDVFFDNIFTDMAFHDEIKRSREQVARAAHTMGGLLQEAKARHQILAEQLTEKEAALNQTRNELQAERGRAFERIGNATTSTATKVPVDHSQPPPPYA